MRPTALSPLNYTWKLRAHTIAILHSMRVCTACILLTTTALISFDPRNNLSIYIHIYIYIINRLYWTHSKILNSFTQYVLISIANYEWNTIMSCYPHNILSHTSTNWETIAAQGQSWTMVAIQLISPQFSALNKDSLDPEWSPYALTTPQEIVVTAC